MKTIEVVAAIIIRDAQVFATQRGYGEFRGWWEFPGGKMEAGESPQMALKREIREELDAEIEVNEHEAATWLTHETLRSVKWLPADEILLDKIADYLR